MKYKNIVAMLPKLNLREIYNQVFWPKKLLPNGLYNVWEYVNKMLEFNYFSFFVVIF